MGHGTGHRTWEIGHETWDTGLDIGHGKLDMGKQKVEFAKILRENENVSVSGIRYQENKGWSLQKFGGCEALAPSEGLTNGIRPNKTNGWI
jgi:hypothetical protein